MLKRSTLVAAALAVALLGLGEPASAVPTWAPAGTATIHPGVMTFTGGGQCTANFVFVSGAGRLHRSGRALLRYGSRHRHQRLHRRLAA